MCVIKDGIEGYLMSGCCVVVSQRTLTMFVGVVAPYLCCVILITECHNSHEHGQTPLAVVWYVAKC